MKKLFILTLLFLGIFSQCIHDQYTANVTKHFYNDLGEKRLLQTSGVGPLRIFNDYNNLNSGGTSQKNLIKRVMNITSNYFYNLLTVQRRDILKYPSDQPNQCGSYAVPSAYINTGVTGDLGIFVGNVPSDPIDYIAKSSPCVLLQSNNRPFWGVVIWNNEKLQANFDQQGVQQLIFIGLHEMTHVLGFSASLYSSFPTNPLVSTSDSYFLSSSEINSEMQKHYGCSNGQGMRLQDQDGTLISSHWEKHDIGNEYMIATNAKSSFVSGITLALLKTTGWYPFVDDSYAEPNVWGRGKGCNFLNINDCDFDEFCEGNAFDCDWDGTGYGRCALNQIAGTCRITNYFTNTICTDQNYEIKIQNLYTQINSGNGVVTFERGGYQSKCFNSDFRQIGQPNFLSNRCYLSVCSSSFQFIYLLVDSYILVCRPPTIVSGQLTPDTINSLPGMQGKLDCPTNFESYCESKKTCAYNCNKNGACINGQCLCHDSLLLSSSCFDVAFTTNQNPGSTGGRLLTKALGKIFGQTAENTSCFEGTILNSLTGECQQCKTLYGCQNCTKSGCIEEMIE